MKKYEKGHMNMSMKANNNYVYVSDDGFTWIMGISIMSLLKHNPDSRIYILSSHISAENIARLKGIAEPYDGEIIIVDIPDDYLLDQLNLRKWLSLVFVRLFVAELLPESIDRIMYLDGDTIILDNLTKLWEEDMDGYICAGVKDSISRSYQRNIGLKKNDFYINAGVILFNMNELRMFPVREKVSDFLQNHYYSNSYGDQDTINAIFAGKIKVLPLRYNVMSPVFHFSYKELKAFRHPHNYYSKKEYIKGHDDPAIIHYTGHFWTRRPWQLGCEHPYTLEFLEYKRRSPWKGHKLSQPKASKLQLLNDKFFIHMPKRLCLHLLGIGQSEIYPRYKRLLELLHGRCKRQDFFDMHDQT